MRFPERLDKTRSLTDIFEVVKDAVYQATGIVRAGLMLALADLGNHPQGFLGAFYPVASNVIVMNKVPLQRIKETSPGLYKPYVFNILLHEYLHSLGYLDEMSTRKKTYEISRDLFGDEHLVTQIALDYSKFFPSLVYPDVAWMPQELSVELVKDFDKGSSSYIR